MRRATDLAAMTLLCALALALGIRPGVGITQTPVGTHVLLVPAGKTVPASARTLARYEVFDLVEATGPDAARLRAEGATQRDDMRLVRLGDRSLDPTRVAKGGAGAAGAELLLVQFVGPVKDAWLARLHGTAARVVTYMAENAYLVHTETAAEQKRVRALAGRPEVRAVITFPTAAKLAPGVRTAGEQQVSVQTLSGADGSAARAGLERVSDRAGPSSNVGSFASRVVRGDVAELRKLAADPAVLSVSPRATPRLYDERAAMILASGLAAPPAPDYLGFLTAHGFGTGVFDFAVDITDEGLDTGAVPGTHPDFFSGGNTSLLTRIAYVHDQTTDANGRDCGGHGTNVASIAAGYNDVAGSANNTNDAQGYNYGLGVAPRARVGATKIFTCNGDFDLSGSFSSMTSAAYAGGARIVNNSWGADTNGAYNADSQAYDAIVRDAQPAVAGNQEIVEVFAAGNDGIPDDFPPDSVNTVGTPATAKNVITVGAVENVRAKGSSDGCGVTDAQANNALDVIDFSSRGPTDDLRHKPDVMAPGTHVAGASPQHGFFNGSGTCDEQFPAGNPLYSLVSGTSQATPQVTGLAALVRDWYQRTVPGANPPSPAMTKALLANTAQDLSGGNNGFGAALSHRPDDVQGWGRVSLGEILDDQPRAFRDQSAEFDASGQALTSSYTVADPGRPLKVSLAWTDPPGPTTGNSFVNNLDLRVVGPDGRFYNGNVTADGTSTANPSVTDPRNNLENVILPPGALTAGFQVTVTGTAIGGDGVPGDGDATDQDFALVVSNATEGLPASSVAGTTSGPSGASPVPAITPPAAALALSFRARTITLDRRNALRWSFASNRPALAGRVSFRSKSKVRVTAGKAKRRLSLGSARFTADSAGTASLRLRVSAKTARILRRLKRLKVTATVVAGGQSVPVSLTLKAPKLRRR